MKEQDIIRSREEEIRRNLDFFLTKREELLRDHKGRYVLLRDRRVVGIYDTMRDARLTGERFFKDKVFSIQKVDPTAVNLGFYSHAVHMAEPQ